MDLVPHNKSHILVLARPNSTLASIIANILKQNNFKVSHTTKSKKSEESWVDHLITKMRKGAGAVIVLDFYNNGTSEHINDLRPLIHEVEVISDYQETLETAKKRIKELESSLQANSLETKKVKGLLSRIHRILIESDNQLDQHKVKLRGIDRAYVEELLDGISELIERAMISSEER